MKKKFIKIAMLLCSMLIVGCSSTKDSNVNSEPDPYLSCNVTSYGIMSELESGYFFVDEDLLFYADKNDLSNWVEVCNKPDCVHVDDDICNAYLDYMDRIVQKNGKLYGIARGNMKEGIYIYEMDIAGNGRKPVYTISDTVEKYISSYTNATFQDRFVTYFGCLNEDGLYEQTVILLEADEKGKAVTQTLYEETSELGGLLIMQGNAYWQIRGDDIIVTSMMQEEDEMFTDNIVRVENGLEHIDFPKDISVQGGYLSGNTFICYKQNDGFYKVDLETGEQVLFSESQMEDGRGYVLSEDYMIECNRYIDNKPEEAKLRFYNGEKWIEIELPEKVKNSDDPFYPVALATDRIFYNHNVRRKGGELVANLYYFMIDEENPELVFCSEVGKNASLVEWEEESSVEETEIESTKDPVGNTDIGSYFEEVVIFDTEEYLLKVTDVYIDSRNRYCLELYGEYRKQSEPDAVCQFSGHYASINGLQCNPQWGHEFLQGESGFMTMCFYDEVLEDYKISDVYTWDEYTDIEIGFVVDEGVRGKKGEEKEKFVHIYPNGKENVITYTREPQSTDQVLVDNEYVSVIVTGYDGYFVPGDTIQVLIHNKTDQYVMFRVDECYANGKEMDEYNVAEGVYQAFVSPGKYTIRDMSFFDGSLGSWHVPPSNFFFKAHRITEVEEIEMVLRAYPSGYYQQELGEDFVNDRFILNP